MKLSLPISTSSVIAAILLSTTSVEAASGGGSFASLGGITAATKAPTTLLSLKHVSSLSSRVNNLNVPYGGASSSSFSSSSSSSAALSFGSVTEARGGSTRTTAPPRQELADASISTVMPVQQRRVEVLTPVVAVVESETNAVDTQGGAAHVSKEQQEEEQRHVCEVQRAKTLYAKKLKNRNHMNMPRKFIHTAFGLFFAGLNHFIPTSKFVPGMTILTTAALAMELLRYKRGFGWMNDALHGVLGSTLRKNEMDGKFTGSFYYFLGVTTTSYLFPKPAATLGICQLAIADPSASFFGKQTRHVYWSRIERGLFGFGRNKGFLGFLGGALACVPLNYRLLSVAKFATPVSHVTLLAASLALGVAGAFADLGVPTPALTLPKKVLGVRVPPFHLDDNFVVPIVAGFACTKLFAVLGWPQDLALGRFLLV